MSPEEPTDGFGDILGEARKKAEADRRRQGHLNLVSDGLPLVLKPARLPDPKKIPPRQWLYGSQLLRGYVSVLVAPGGVGKTSYAMGAGVSLASGRSLFGDRIFERVNVAILNLEDPMDELDRRLAALMMHHGVERHEIEGRFYMYSADDRRITMAQISEDGFNVEYPDEQQLIQEITAHQIGVLIIDPFAESHNLEENSNHLINKAVGVWRNVARATGCAIFLIHHVRKGVVTDIDSARGAKALTDSARVGLIMAAMTEEEATRFGIELDDRKTYVQLLDGKSNMARQSGVGRWFELSTVELGNATEDYPTGDRVAAIARWYPPSALGDLTTLQCNEALDNIAAGPRPDVLYGYTNSAKSNRWAGTVLMQMFGMTDKRAAGILSVWLKNGVIEQREYADPEQRKPRLGVYVNAAKRPGVESR
jgi:AAA domain